MHIPLWGASLTTPHVAVTSVDAASEATVVAAVEVANTGGSAADATVLVEVIKPDGSLGGQGTAKATAIPAAGNSSVSVSIPLTGGVALWCTSSPALHSANITVSSSSGSHDSLVVQFGVRSISFNATHGESKTAS